MEINPSPTRREGGRAPLPVTITFMSDTAVQALGLLREGRLTEVDDLWREALGSTVVVAHMSDAPAGEVRELARYPALKTSESVARFDTTVAQLLQDRRDEGVRLVQALSLVDASISGTPATPLGAGFVDKMESWSHLYLHGLLAVARAIEQMHDGVRRVLVIGEFREQLGSFRGTVAREINRHLFCRPGETDVDALENTRPVALTADIGLHIRLSATRPQQVRCSTCALDNDRLDGERYHPPQEIHEVCVKGDHEATYWNCSVHDPARRDWPVFVEQMDRYDPLAAGGRVHG